MNFLKILNWYLETLFGVNLRRLIITIRGVPKIVADYFIFRRAYPDGFGLRLCFGDHFAQSGDGRGEYFYQDLHVAQLIAKRNPKRHIDIGSRVTGFVAHVASFRKIEVLDLRPQESVVQNVKFIEHDFCEPYLSDAPVDSVSCLHALEHFGLGRYGDDISNGAFDVGLQNLFDSVSPEGHLYLSLPVGIEKIFFNSHRVSDPMSIYLKAKSNGFTLLGLSYYFGGKFVCSSEILDDLAMLQKESYALAVYDFQKIQ